MSHDRGEAHDGRLRGSFVGPAPLSASPGGWAIVPVLVARVVWAVLGHHGAPALDSPAAVSSHPASVSPSGAAGSPAGTGGYPYASATCEYGASGGPDCAAPGDPGNLYNWG